MEEGLPKGWAWARLREVSAVSGGLTKNPGRMNWPDKVPFLRVGNVQAGRLDLTDVRTIGVLPSELARVLLQTGDLLIVEGNGSLDQIGRCAVWDGKVEGCAHQNHIIKARMAEGVSPDWASLWFASVAGRKLVEQVASSTSGLHTLSINKISGLGLPIAPAPEQARIVSEVSHLFGELDAAEAGLARARAGLAQYRASLLHAACTGQLTAAWRAARPPPAEDGPALLRRLATARRQAWEQGGRGRWKEAVRPDTDGLPALPDGWAWASVDQLSASSNYGTSVKCDVAEHGTPVLRIPNVQSGSISWSNLKYATADLGLDGAQHLRKGDLLIVRTNGSPSLVGRAALVDDEPPQPSYFASYLIRFRLAGPAVVHRWLARLFASELIRSQVARVAATSAGQYNVSQTNLAQFAIPLPPLEEIETACKLLDEVELNADDWPTEAFTLRQSILHAACTGRLVPQDTADEPAHALLARVRAIPRRARAGAAPSPASGRGPG